VTRRKGIKENDDNFFLKEENWGGSMKVNDLGKKKEAETEESRRQTY